MKSLIIGDLHFGARSSSKQILNMMDTFFSEELFPYIKENNIKEVICLGDFFDKRTGVDFMISSYIKRKFFPFFKENNVHFYSIVGNHDIYFRNSMKIVGPKQIIDDDNSYIHFISSPEEHYIGKKKFLFIPWICEENAEEIITYLNNNIDNNTIVLGHFEIEGFLMHGNTYCESGSINTDILSKFEYVISGHFHTPSNSNIYNIMYVGTPYELTWNDYNDKKRFLVYDDTVNKFDEILTKTKLFHNILYCDGLEKTIDYKKYNNTYVKIIIPDDVDTSKVSKFLDKLNDISKPLNIQTVQKTNIKLDEDENDDEITSVDIENPFEILLNMIDNDTTIKNNSNALNYAKTKAMEFFKIATEQTKF